MGKQNRSKNTTGQIDHLQSLADAVAQQSPYLARHYVNCMKYVAQKTQTHLYVFSVLFYSVF